MLNGVEQLFLATTPKELWQEVVRMLDRACAKAWGDAHAMYPAEEAFTVYPVMRRGNVEAGLRAIASRFSEVTAEPVLNSVRNCFHTEIKVGHFLVTEARATEPGTSVRPALYRDGIAATYQLPLDIALDEETFLIDGTQAAILQYGPASRERWRLGFAEMVFVDRDSQPIGRLDMVWHFAAPAVVEDAVETITPPMPQLRELARKEEDRA